MTELLTELGPTPRLDSAAVRGFTGRRVRLVGSIPQVRDGDMSYNLQTPDGGQVAVRCENTSNIVGAKIVEVVGLVNVDGSVTELSVAPFNEEFDLKLYGNAIAALTKHNFV